MNHDLKRLAKDALKNTGTMDSEHMVPRRIVLDLKAVQAAVVRLADAGSSFWRLSSRLRRSDTGDATSETRGALRHLEATWTALGEAGVQIIDHTGEPFHHGLALTVIAFQPTKGLTREEVVETIRPTIYFGPTLLQMGEVIVGTPEEDASSGGLSADHN